MQKHNFTLAYSKDNEDVAQEIYQYLSKADINLTLVSDSTAGKESIGEKLVDENNPVLLLVSTNFLKNIGSMNNVLKPSEKLAKNKILHPIIINGKERMPDGSHISVQTNFDRVSHVIHYMNHWQDKYLDARKEKRAAPANMENEIDRKLKNIRNISSEIGEFLKLIKSQNYTSYTELSHNNFEGFFRRFGIEENHSKIANLSIGAMGGVLAGKVISNNINTTQPPIIESPKIQQNVDDQVKKIVDPTPVAKTPPIIEDTPVIETPPPVVEPPSTRKPPRIIEITPEDEIPSVEINEIGEKPDLVQPTSDQVPNEVNELRPNNIDKNIPEVVNEIPADEQPVSVSDLDEVTPLKINDIPEFKDTDLDGEIDNLKPNVPPPSDKEVLDQLIHIKNGDEIGPGMGVPHTDENSVENLSVIQRIIRKREEEKRKAFDQGDDVNIYDDKIGDKVIEVPIDRNKDSNNKKPGQKSKPQKSASDVEQTLHEASNFIEAGQINKGLAILQEVLDQDANNVNVRLQYATVLSDHLNKKSEAVNHLQKVLSLDPHNGDAYIKLGEISESKNNLVVARKYYEKATALKPNQPWIFYKLGIMISTHFVGENEVAASFFKQSLQLDKNNADGHYRYAVIMGEDLKNYEKAIKHFKKVLKLKPDHKRVHLDLAKLYHKNAEHTKAEKHYAKAVRNYPLIKNANNDALFLQKKEAIQPVIEKVQPVVEDATPVSKTEKVEQVFRVPETEIKRVLITGATSGIGKATAEIFAKNGHKLILTGRRKDRLEILKTAFSQKYNSDIELLSFDVKEVDEVRKSFGGLSEEWRDIDILINNAGLAKGFDAIHEGELSDWDQMIDTNIKGLLYMTRAFSPIMVEKRSGHIINVCSTAGTEVYPKGNVYCATKSAVEALTKAIRLDLHKYNVRVSQVSPGHVEETEFAKVRFGDLDRARIYDDFQPLKAVDVAEAIYFIATRPDYVNIQDILMMGTQQANNNYIDRSGRRK